MANSIRKDVEKRLRYQNFEIQQKVLKALVLNCQLNPIVRRKLSWQYARLCSLTSFLFVRNTCVFSGRSRSVYSFFMLSRLCIKVFFKGKMIPNLSKSSW